MFTDNKAHSAHKVLSEKLHGIKVAMLTTIDQKHNILRSRPMVTQEADFDGELWFFTQVEAPLVDEAENRQVNLSYSEPKHHRYVSVSGVAQLVRDKKRIDKLWKSDYETWFPAGKDDPGLTLLKVSVTSAEYWDASVNKMIQVFQETQ